MNLQHDDGPVYPVRVQSDGSGGIIGYQTGPISGWHTGISLRELASIEFTKVHLADLMAIECHESSDERIKEAVTRGWRTTNEWMQAREFFMSLTPSAPPKE